MSYFGNVTSDQNIVLSEDNCSETPLDYDATFTGTALEVYQHTAIQIFFKADERATVYLDQGSADDTFELTDEWSVPAGQVDARSVTSVAPFFRVRVTNTSMTSANMTEMMLMCAVTPALPTLPRHLSACDRLMTMGASVDSWMWPAFNTPMGENRSVSPTRLVGSSFDGTTVDPRFWTATVANDGTVAQANAQIKLSTNTTANGSATLNSVRRARYVSGMGMRYRTQIQVSAGAANNKRRWGIAWGATMPTVTDGAWFQLNGTTFSIVTCKGTSETKVDSGSFNGCIDPSYVIGTDVHSYEIYWTNGKVYFVVDQQLLHTVSASSATWANTMAHYIYMDNVNSSDIETDHTLECRVASIHRLGDLLTQPISYYQSGTTAGVILKYGAGNLHGIAIGGTSNNAVVTLYDNTAASGTTVWASGTMGSNTVPFSVDLKGLPFSIGLTLVISGAAANATVIYE